MKQQGSYYSTGFPVTKTRFSQRTSNMESLKPVLNMEKMPTFNTVETSRLNHTEKLNQVRCWRSGIELCQKYAFELSVLSLRPDGKVDHLELEKWQSSWQHRLLSWGLRFSASRWRLTTPGTSAAGDLMFPSWPLQTPGHRCTCKHLPIHIK